MKPGAAESHSGCKCCLQQGSCFRRINLTGTSQCNVVQRGTTGAEEPAHPCGHQTPAHPGNR